MVLRLFLVYVVVELAVVIALASTIGFGWTLLVLLAAFVVGLTLAGSQVTRQLMRLRSGFTAPAVSDGALVGLGSVLVVVPGLVTSAAGLLLLVPATRTVVRPVLTAMAVRGIGRRVPLITGLDDSEHRGYRPDDRDYIDGEVIDVTDVEPPPLPHRHD
jgi:UPF0716 protein FxsA